MFPRARECPLPLPREWTVPAESYLFIGYSFSSMKAPGHTFRSLLSSLVTPNKVLAVLQALGNVR